MRDVSSVEVIVILFVDLSVDLYEDVCVLGSIKIDCGVDGEDVVVVSVDLTESYGVAKES